MSKLKFTQPQHFDYEAKVKTVLEKTEEPMSVKDIRLELTYQQNGLEPVEGYSLQDIESAVEQAVDKLVEQNENDALDSDLTRKPVIYQQDRPAEIEETETRYNLI